MMDLQYPSKDICPITNRDLIEQTDMFALFLSSSAIPEHILACLSVTCW